MDGSRFAALSRALATDHSRRRLTRLLGGVALASPVAWLGLAEAGAKRKHHKHHKHHKKKHASPPPVSCGDGQRSCQGSCIPSNQCCTDADCPATSPACCGGECLDVRSDERHCGSCGTRCTVNEQCIGGACLCGGSVCSTQTPSFSCCSGTNQFCGCAVAFLDVSTNICGTVNQCPAGTTPCIATTNNCVGAGPAHVCCPLESICSAEGTCLIA